jgi:UDP-glucose 4-epimerase
VVGLDNLSTGKRENLVGLDAIEFIESDLNDAQAVARACSGVEVVFHEAAIASVPFSILDPVSSNKANVTGTLQLLLAARDAKVRRVVYAGSSAAYGNSPLLPKHEGMLPQPISPYAVSKLTGEYYLTSFADIYGIETVTLRYFNVFGPFQDPASQYSGVLAKFTLAMLHGIPPTIYGDGEQSRDFTYIDNVVNANLLASDAPASAVSGRIFNVATGTRITLNETVKILRELAGYTGPVNYGAERYGDVKHSQADIALARKYLDYEVTIGFVEGLRRTLEWYRSVDSAQNLAFRSRAAE